MLPEIDRDEIKDEMDKIKEELKVVTKWLGIEIARIEIPYKAKESEMELLQKEFTDFKRAVRNRTLTRDEHKAMRRKCYEMKKEIYD